MATSEDGQADVVVVGAGVIGLAVAWRLQGAGLSTVVVDPDPGGGASHVAAGMLAPVGELAYGEEELLALGIDSARRWPAFAEEVAAASDLPVGYVAAGTLHVAADAGDYAYLEDLWRFHGSLGLDSTLLSTRECREREPLLAPGVRGGFFAAGDHQVDNRLLLAALGEAVRRSGAALVRHSVARVDVAGDRATGVTLDDGRTITAGHVVLAAGWRSGTLAGLPPGAVPPVRPVKGQLLRLESAASGLALRQTLRGLVNGRPVYLVPRASGELLLGATSEEMPATDASRSGAVRILLDDALRVFPAVDETSFVASEAAMRPGSPDNRPLIGPAGLDGLVLATGHYRGGILLAPMTADLVAACLVSGATAVPSIPASCSPGRFAERPFSGDEATSRRRPPATERS